MYNYLHPHSGNHCCWWSNGGGGFYQMDADCLRCVVCMFHFMIKLHMTVRTLQCKPSTVSSWAANLKSLFLSDSLRIERFLLLKGKEGKREFPDWMVLPQCCMIIMKSCDISWHKNSMVAPHCCRFTGTSGGSDKRRTKLPTQQDHLLDGTGIWSIACTLACCSQSWSRSRLSPCWPRWWKFFSSAILHSSQPISF